MSVFVTQPIVKTFGSTPSSQPVPVFTPVSASDSLVNDGDSFLYIKNAGGSIDSINLSGVVPCDQGNLYATNFNLAPGSSAMFGPFPVNRFGVAPIVTHSFITGVTAAFINVAI